MRLKALIYYIIAGFLVSVLIVVMVQYVTNDNVKDLISGNEDLVKQYRMSSELGELQKDLLLLENGIKTAVITGDASGLKNFQARVTKIREDENVLSKNSVSGSDADITELRSLIDKRIRLSNQEIESFYKSGKPSTEKMISDSNVIKLSEDIRSLIQKIDTGGRIARDRKIKIVDQSGQKVLDWNLYVIVLVIILLAIVLVVIINRMQTQAALIEQLNTSEKKLKEAAQVKENFLANMSHEIRTPLNAILGYTDLLRRKKLDQDSLFHIETVHQSGESLLGIVNDILDLSKIESGMMRVEKLPFSLNSVVQTVMAMFHHKAEEKGLALTSHFTPEIPETVIGDTARLSQILVNLIGNAVKFTSEGAVTLNIQAQQKDATHIQIEFNVTDTGIGIEKDKLETIFERFRQAEDSTTRKYGGTGLGLSISRDLVYLQGGEIDVRSKSGQGTSVVVTIPYEVFNQPKPSDFFDHGHIKKELITGRKILIVEDNEINQGLMSRLMDEWEIGYSIAGNGKEAIKILKNETFDLVLMDIQMPEMDGYAATVEIRQKLKLDLPIIAMTAHAMAGEKEKCMSYGMNDHIAKPVRIADLERVFGAFLNEKNFPKSSHPVDQNVDYQVIVLDYLREISDGDREYEKRVTEQFLSMVPQEFTKMELALEQDNQAVIKRIAHNMKTTISMMGLDSKLYADLDALEYANPGKAEMKELVTRISEVCRRAVEDAKAFYSRF